MPNLRARLHPGALLLHLVLAAFFTWPLVLGLSGNGMTPGTIVEDRDQNLWNLWWTKTALLSLHNPFQTDMIYWPTGVSLQFHTLNVFNGLVSIPFQAFLPLPVVYDGIVLLSFVLTGWGTYLLLQYLLSRLPVGPQPTRGALASASAVGSSVFAYSAYHLATQRGLLQLISLEWVPFYVLFLLRAVHDGPAWTDGRAVGRWLAVRGLPAAFFLLLVALVDWYYVMYTLLFTAFYWLYLVARPASRKSFSVLWVALIVALFFVMVGPLLLPMFDELQHATYMRPRPGLAVENSADLLAFFIPTRLNQLWGSLSGFRLNWPFAGNTYEVYLSNVGLATAGIGLLGKAREGRAGLPPRAFWAVLVVLFGVLTLGPVLQVNGVEYTGVGPMPYALIERIPGFNISRSPDRFAMPMMLCLSVLSAYGALRLAAVLPTAWRERAGGPALLAGGLIALMALELWPIPYPQIPAPIPAFYKTLGQDTADYAILELPREDSYWHGAIRMYFQTAHHKRIFYGYISREFYHPFLFSTPGFMELENPDGLGDIFADGPTEWLSALADANTRYIVLYKAGWRSKPPPTDESGRYRAEIGRILGAEAVAQPVHSDADLDMYSVPPPPQRVPYLTLGDGWGSREAAPGDVHRWIRNDATLGLNSPRPLHAALVFTAAALGADRALNVHGDGGGTVTLTVAPAPREYRVDLGTVPAGTGAISLSSPGPVHSPNDLGMSDDTRLLGIEFSKVRLELVP